MLEFLTHDYFGYIWGSVALTLIILIGNAGHALYQLRRAQKK